MATIEHITTDVGETRQLACWANLANGDEGSYVEWAELADNTVTIHGTFGTGGSIRMLGSNDAQNWFVLTSFKSLGDAVFTSAGIMLLLERPRYIKPEVTAGDVSTDLTCYIMLR